MMQYKGYVGHVEYDDEAKIFHGEVVNTRDIITFQGTTVKQLETEFKKSVDDYLDFCKERGESPDKPFSGTLNLRLTPDLHRDAYLAAHEEGLSLNKWIVLAVREAAGQYRGRDDKF